MSSALNAVVASDIRAPSAIETLDGILRAATELHASDVHLLPQQQDALRVRFRIDGVIHEEEPVPRSTAIEVVARVKVLGSLDVAEHRKPQDGRFAYEHDDGTTDVRVAILPANEGEGVVLRLLDTGRAAPTLTEIGLSNRTQMELERVLAQPTGTLLVSGPTGSGKSTTVYAALSDLSRPEINVITIEDPVEYRLPGIYQIQVNSRIGVTFASALRSVLRADPDVIMVGEIRDEETATLAVEAAATGHLVLSTLHAPDAPATLTRLLDIGVEPYLVASSISAVLGQRLVRKLCEICREPYEASLGELEQLFEAGLTAATLYRPRGCSECYRGYSGRVGLFELMRMEEALRELVVKRAPRHVLAESAQGAGMIGMRADALGKVAAGETSLDELRRVLG